MDREARVSELADRSGRALVPNLLGADEREELERLRREVAALHGGPPIPGDGDRAVARLELTREEDVDPTTRDGGDDPATTALHLVLGAASVVWRAGAPLRGVSVAAVRGAGTVVSTLAPTAVATLVRRGLSARVTLERLADMALRLTIRRVVTAFLQTVDITELVREHVDLDAVAAGLDVDAVVARADLDAAVARVDLDAVARRLDLDALAAGLDLDRIVTRVDLDAAARRLDLDGIAARLDLDRVVARVDLDAIIARIDLEELARQVIDAVDLPDIVRHSTGTLTSETVRSVRTEAMHADDVVTGLVDRLLRRSRVQAQAHSPAAP
jgi:hypothetical protein